MQQDLGRTFPSNAWVSTAEGLAALRRVLLAFSAHSPRIGYCQSMNFLAAALLLALGRAEDSAFWVLVCLIDDGGGPSTLRRTYLSCQFMLVIRLLSHQLCKRMLGHAKFQLLIKKLLLVLGHTAGAACEVPAISVNSCHAWEPIEASKSLLGQK